MKRMRNKVFRVILSLALVLALMSAFSACGKASVEAAKISEAPGMNGAATVANDPEAVIKDTVENTAPTETTAPAETETPKTTAAETAEEETTAAEESAKARESLSGNENPAQDEETKTEEEMNSEETSEAGMPVMPGPVVQPGDGGGIISSGYDMPGSSRDYYLAGYSEEIKSQDIVMFSYVAKDYVVFYGPKDDVIYVSCRGGDASARDGSAFAIALSPDLDDPAEAEKVSELLTRLQKAVVSGNVSRDNGHTHETSGLPWGIGDTISIEYESGEKIYRYSNQYRNVNEQTASLFYDAFHDYVKKCGLDFTTEGSNLQIYDDADEEFVQGTWKGEHFGDEFVVTFEGKNVKIYKDGVLTDDCEYSITNGIIRTNELITLKEGEKYRGDQFDYEEFSEISELTKHNYFTMDAYFMKDSSSSCWLQNFDKPNPEKEN